MNPEIEVKKLLKDSCARLVRTKRHLVWKLPNGRTFTQAGTPSDPNAGWSELRDLRRALAIPQSSSACGQG